MPEPSLPPAVQQQLATLQQLNQQYQVAAQQRAQFEAMKMESEQAIAALDTLSEDAPVYRNVGAFLVKEPSRKAALERLKEDMETLGIRLSRVQKQEQQLREQLGALQQKIQSAMQGKM